MKELISTRGRRVVWAVAVAALAALAAGPAITAWQQPADRWADIGPYVPVDRLSDSAFAALITRISEPGGFFDSDNLVSNETEYLRPITLLHEMGVKGGGYLGVGPDQNYSYIAHIRPEIAFMVDIRRDAALQHLLYKVLMTRARNRVEYLALLTARPVPDDVEKWKDRDILEITRYFDTVEGDRLLFDSTVVWVRRKLEALPHPISEYELQTIARIQGEFHTYGLDLRYTSLNRPARRNYPTWRSLMLETDAAGRMAGYLASEEAFQSVRSMHERNLIIPVTGNLAGPHAVREIGEYLAERGLRVSALYTSNVEFYLWREQSFNSFADNVTQLPFDARSMIIRSYFNNGGYYYAPQGRRGGSMSVQLMQPLGSFVKEFRAGGYREYRDVISKHIIETR